MRPVTQTRALVAAVVGAICAAQTTAGAANLLINGTLASGGVATLAAQQTLGVTCAADIHTVNFTFTGTDDQGRVITETIAGPTAGATVKTALNYRTVTQIAVSAAVGTNVTVDTLQIGASTEVPLDLYTTAFNVSIAVEVTGTVNYTVQYTFDDVFGGAPGPFVWNNFTTLTAQTANGNGTIISPVRAVRLLTNSGGGTAKMLVVQSGLT